MACVRWADEQQIMPARSQLLALQRNLRVPRLMFFNTKDWNFKRRYATFADAMIMLVIYTP
eukprot:6204782-Pleurochrysis_carterae.AAC.4